MLIRADSKRKSWFCDDVDEYLNTNIKLNHAQVANLCTQTVEKFRGHPDLIDSKCEKIRRRYFDQWLK